LDSGLTEKATEPSRQPINLFLETRVNPRYDKACTEANYRQIFQIIGQELAQFRIKKLSLELFSLALMFYRFKGRLDERSFTDEKGVSFANLVDLEELSMDFLNVNVIYPRTFSVFPHLNYLKLTTCNLREIKAGAFDGLPSLESLDLSVNQFLSDQTDSGTTHFLEGLQSLVFLRIKHTAMANSPSSLEKIKAILPATCYVQFD
jgi:hypothetical protein